MEEYLLKPFLARELMDAVQRALLQVELRRGGAPGDFLSFVLACQQADPGSRQGRYSMEMERQVLNAVSVGSREDVERSVDGFLQECVLQQPVPAALNYGEILDPGYDTYIGDYLAATDTDRQMYCELMCQYFTQTAPIVPICFEKTEMLTHRGVVSGASPTQYDLFHDFASWTIEIERGDAAQ